VMVDVLFATAGIEPEIVAAAEVLEVLPGILMPVATAGHLVVLKLLARDDENRPQDATDLPGAAPGARRGRSRRRAHRRRADRGAWLRARPSAHGIDGGV